MSNFASVELDIHWDGAPSHEFVANTIADDFGVTCELVTENGPNGLPVYIFDGPWEAIVDLERCFYV